MFSSTSNRSSSPVVRIPTSIGRWGCWMRSGELKMTKPERLFLKLKKALANCKRSVACRADETGTCTASIDATQIFFKHHVEADQAWEKLVARPKLLHRGSAQWALAHISPFDMKPRGRLQFFFFGWVFSFFLFSSLGLGVNPSVASLSFPCLVIYLNVKQKSPPRKEHDIISDLSSSKFPMH